ncbi:Lrp/AsnC family transcriptional regulator [Pseudomonas sp. CT11-2]|uniref:Lrp/AsnC family transcriptional regulator n=1 Tax=unclassified Pseudomonas TaxID=196821 RepID=UPI00215F7C5D|nr:Lrp/AsnC family transcriptional regulator [Pseudomonas sp. B21-019]UVM30749.1 Lrp/AsnC family transcriptional regulator [Pseudomonas sp. B21-019]
MTLDEFDIKLLIEIQQDATLSQIELGKRVSLSSAAVNRRLKRLNDEGVIKKTIAVIEPAAMGHPLTIIAEVEVESERIDLLDAMKQSFAACPQVQQCYYVAGEWDFVLIFAVRSMQQYTDLTRELFFENNNVKRFKTLVSMSTVKLGLNIPLGVE